MQQLLHNQCKYMGSAHVVQMILIPLYHCCNGLAPCMGAACQRAELRECSRRGAHQYAHMLCSCQAYKDSNLLLQHQAEHGEPGEDSGREDGVYLFRPHTQYVSGLRHAPLPLLCLPAQPCPAQPHAYVHACIPAHTC